MTDKLSSCETDHIKPAIPVIQVNGEGVEADEATEGYVQSSRLINLSPRNAGR